MATSVLADMPLPIWNHPTAVTASTVPAPQATACAGQGDIAVTFNEGPSDVTAKVLNGLKAGQAKASFFVNATWLYTQQYAMILQRAYNDGHLIGMTYRPPGDSSEGFTDQQIMQDVSNNAKIIETLIGVSPKYVRLHYSQPEDYRLEHIVRSMGYTLIAYNLDPQDYNYKGNPAGIGDFFRSSFAKQLDTYDSKGSFITMQYDIPDTGSWQAIYDQINAINDAGYTMVRLDGCLQDKEPYKQTASKKSISDKHSYGNPDYKKGQVAVEVPESLANNTVDTSDIQIVKKSDGYHYAAVNLLVLGATFLGTVFLL
ncbi:glycoside hydrolase/deacetylase [Hesseltinella vesiculosa]|uniref:Glycoside hydrolase/deacetylase n=1 Tax=Hesseltinella vesiculosa TaxID=101127 RepID=A0A1X2GN84_9FUNG|nr:glycoside hydrolase/deacetylase [Hesseltinella vesiculosa]